MPRRKAPQRRAKGEGNYWQDPEGRHHYRIAYAGRKYEVANPDPDRALAEFNQLREALKQGIHVADGKQSLRTFAEYCHSQRLGGKETTKYDRDKRFRSCIAPILGDRRLCDITTSDIWSWWETIQKVYAYNSAKQALSLLKRILDIAVIDKLIPYNPAAPIKPRKPSDETAITQTLASEDVDEQEDGIGKAMALHQVWDANQPAEFTTALLQGARATRLGEWIATDEGNRFDLEFRFHDLRHTASQHMEDAGVQDKVRAAILGHASVKVTREVYTHASPEAKRDAIHKVHNKGT